MCFVPGEERGKQRLVWDFVIVLGSEDWGEARVTPLPGKVPVRNRSFLKCGTWRTYDHISGEQDSC